EIKAPATTHDSVSKQACTILYVRPGHFESIQSFSKQLDLSVLGNQPRKEELMKRSAPFCLTPQWPRIPQRLGRGCRSAPWYSRIGSRGRCRGPIERNRRYR